MAAEQTNEAKTSEKTPAETTVMDRLRVETRPLHEEAENHPFQKAFASGQAPKSQYINYLSQMYLVHATLETALTDAAESTPAIAAVAHERQFQAANLETDLEYLGVADADTIETLPATRRLLDAIDEIAELDPASLLGLHYVLEGSKNGAKFLARVIGKAYGLTPGPGLRYLDPHGDEQRPLWIRFRTDMAAVPMTDAQEDRIVLAAETMFRGMIEIFDDLDALANEAHAPIIETAAIQANTTTGAAPTTTG
ncbi:MAG: biliverdin-producing heme oxygenase [Phycisphaerales bacterium]